MLESFLKNKSVLRLVQPKNSVITACSYLFLSWIYAFASQIIIPLPFNLVPMTIQPAPLLLAAFMFGRHAVYAYFLYLLQGALGLPFFAGMQGGFLRLLGPTGGYLIGFGLAMTFVAYIKNYIQRSFFTVVATLFVAEAISFACGLAQLAFFVPAHNLLASGLYPFLVGDFIIKIIFVAVCLRLHTKAKFLSKFFIIGFAFFCVSFFKLGAMQSNDSAKCFHNYCLHGNAEQAMLLLKESSNPRVMLCTKNIFGLTPLHCAVSKNHTNIVCAVANWAEETGNLSTFLTIQDDFGDSLLHCAVSWRNFEIVKTLISCARRHGFMENLLLSMQNCNRQTVLDLWNAMDMGSKKDSLYEDNIPAFIKWLKILEMLSASHCIL